MASPAKDADPSTAVKVTIETRSWVIRTADPTLPAAPVIRLNGKDFPRPKGGLKGAHGYQVFAIDAARDMTDPASILLNEYHYLPIVDNSFTHYEHMYRQMVHGLLSAGDPGWQRVFIVSFGMAAHAPPPLDAYEYLIGLGAGRALQRWEASRKPGENGTDHYIEHPACYMLLGYSAAGYGRGVEAYDDSVQTGGNDPGEVVTLLDATLHNPITAPHQPHPAGEHKPVGHTVPPAKDADPSTAVKVTIDTKAWSVPRNAFHDPEPPSIKLNGKDFPAPENRVNGAHGYQLIATDAAKDMTDPASILLNEYHYLPRVYESYTNHSYTTYEDMYRQMVHALLSAGNPAQQRVFIVSFGMAAHAPPPVDVYEYLIRLGAGSELQRWEAAWAPGENSADNYIEHPACYILLGQSSLGYGRGIEQYHDEVEWRGTHSRMSAHLEVTLHNRKAAPHVPRAGSSR